jgi:general secretion pathway protein K
MSRDAIAARARPHRSARVPCRTRRCVARRRLAPLAPRRKQRGVALLVAILLVALGTIIAAAMAYDNAMTARRSEATFDFDQALLVAEGAEATAAYALRETALNTAQNITYPAQPWGEPLGPIEVAHGVTLEASLEDLQGRFNVNTLVESDGVTPNPIALAAFRKLLEEVQVDPKWADDLLDWIDKSNIAPDGNGAEDSVYMEKNPPYQAPHLVITSTSELLALPGFGRENFEKIAPYIAALPVSAPLNVCSASPQVLDAYLSITQFSSDPKQFAQDRASKGGCFPTLNDYSAAYKTAPIVMSGAGAGGLSAGGPSAGPGAGPNGPTLPGFTQLFTDKSSYFRLTSLVTAGPTEFAVYSLLYRPDGPPYLVRPILRSFTPN